MKTGLDNLKKIVILTGAGISAESGISTFRDSGGLWEKYKIEEVATPEAYAKNPLLVWKFYSMRRIQAAQAEPNKAHKTLAQLGCSKSLDIHLITQNVDDLHQRADSRECLPPISMHGSLSQSRCTLCGTNYFDNYAYFDADGNYAPQETNLLSLGQRASQDYLHHYKLDFKDFLPLSPCCKGPIRPHIVWFGEIPLHMAKIDRLISEAELFVSIGTSGQVYPAAGFLQLAKAAGAKTVCINKEEVPQNNFIDLFIQGNATKEVPEFFKSFIEQS